MTKLELLNRLSTLLGRFSHEVSISNSLGLFDINTFSEDFLIPVFKLAFEIVVTGYSTDFVRTETIDLFNDQVNNFESLVTSLHDDFPELLI